MFARIMAANPEDYQHNFSLIKDIGIYKVGMVLMGVIDSVWNKSVMISLPGRGKCTLMIDKVSEALFDEMSKAHESNTGKKIKFRMQDYFTIGRLIVVQMYSVRDKLILVSTKPKDILSSVNRTDLYKVGVTLTCAIKSIEETGYILETGLDNVIAYLRNSSTKYKIGQLVNVCISSVAQINDNRHVFTTEEVSENIENEVVNDLVNVDSLVPGMKIKVMAIAETKTGWILSWTSMGKHYRCYAYNHFIPHNKKFVNNTEYCGHVLYIEPLTKYIHISLKDQDAYLIDPNTDMPKNIHYHIGDFIHSAVVVKIYSFGLGLVLTGQNNVPVALGFLNANEIKDSGERFRNLGKEFSIGSTISCRIVRYHACNQVFACSKRKDILEEKILCSRDAKVGMIVDATVSELTSNTYYLTAGPNKVPMIMKKTMTQNTNLKKGDTIKAKVIWAKPIEVTNKHRIMASKLPLAGYNEKLELDTDYEGVVTDISHELYFVYFSTKISGVLRFSDKYSFSVNQIIRCRLTTEKRSRRGLYQLTVNDDSTQDIAIGYPYKVKIIEVQEDGFLVSLIQEPTITGFIYLHQLSQFKPFVEFDRFNQNLTINSIIDAIAITNDQPPYLFSLNLFTIRAVDYCQKVAYPSDVRRNVPAIIKEVYPSRNIVVRIIEKTGSYDVCILQEDLDPDEGNFSYCVGQSIMVSIQPKVGGQYPRISARRYKISLQLSDFHVGCDSLVTMLCTIQNHYGVEFGCVVNGKAKREMTNGLLLELDCPGRTMNASTLERVEFDDKKNYQCVLLGFDLDKEALMATTNKATIKDVLGARDRDGLQIGSLHKSRIIFSCSVYAIALLKGHFCGKLVYISKMCHPNFPEIDLRAGTYIQVAIQQIYRNKIIGLAAVNYNISTEEFKNGEILHYYKYSLNIANNIFENDSPPVNIDDLSVRKRDANSNHASSSCKKPRT